MAVSFIQSFRQFNPNVRFVFIFTFLQGFGRGIWMGNILSAYIFYIAGESNTLLGYTSAATGLAMTTVIFPAGYLADRYRRDTLLRVSTIFGFLGLGLAIYAQDLWLLMGALFSWGLFQGFNRPALESIFADSVKSGNRSEIYSQIQLVRQLSMAIGPFVNIGLFYFLGDVWELDILRTVMIIGILLSAFSVFFLFRLNDDQSVGEESESIYQEKVETKVGNTLVSSSKLIPIVVIGSNLIIGVGAGMTIKFFPIFFIEIYDLKPIPVNFILGLTFIFTGLASIMAQKFSMKNGRVQMMIVVQGIAILCLYLISLYPLVLLMAVLYIARGGLMNASQPLSRSILMDVVSKEHRGKVNSIEALAWGLFWNMSAAVGGVLIDAFSYAWTFRVTATVYLLGTLPLFIIIPLVKVEEKAEQNGKPDEAPVCPSCQTVNTNQDQFCAQCGTALVLSPIVKK